MLIGIDASRAVTAQRTGTEHYSLYLIRALIERGGHNRFRLYFNQPPEADLFAQNDRVTWRCLPFPRLWTHMRLAWETLWHPPDVLYVPSHVLPWLQPACCVATVHDLGYLYYPEAHTRFARWYLDWSTRFNARASRRVIVDSEATGRDLEQHYGIDPAKVVVAYPAGNEELKPVSDPTVLHRIQAKYATGERYLLHLGTLQPRKNLGALVSAFEQLSQSGRLAQDVRLVLAGKQGWLAEELLQQIASSAVRERIVLPGYVASEDAAGLLSGALTYVMPSWYEGFGLPVLEAMACEVPVICSNVSSLPEVAGDAALLFDPHDVTALAQAIEQVCDDEDLRRELVARGRQNVKRFGWDRCAQTVLDALEAACADD